LLSIVRMHRTLTLAHPLTTPRARPLDPATAVVLATLLTATLDGLEATTFCALRGIAPERALQGVATGLLGRAAFAGGAATTALGAALLGGICAVIVAIYLAASRRFAALRRSPWRSGALYGVAVFAVMNFVVVPLSAAGGRPLRVYALVNCLLANIACIGIPTALVARATGPQGTGRDRG
jgi:hypothetical protein